MFSWLLWSGVPSWSLLYIKRSDLVFLTNMPQRIYYLQDHWHTSFPLALTYHTLRVFAPAPAGLSSKPGPAHGSANALWFVSTAAANVTDSSSIVVAKNRFIFVFICIPCEELKFPSLPVVLSRWTGLSVIDHCIEYVLNFFRTTLLSYQLPNWDHIANVTSLVPHCFSNYKANFQLGQNLDRYF